MSIPLESSNPPRTADHAVARHLGRKRVLPKSSAHSSRRGFVWVDSKSDGLVCGDIASGHCGRVVIDALGKL